MTRTPSTSEPLLFGIYPGGATGEDRGGLAVGPPDDPAAVSAALDRLQGSPDRPFLVRAYTHFDDVTRLGCPHPTATPAGAEQYATGARRLDLVGQYRSAAGDVDGSGPSRPLPPAPANSATPSCGSASAPPRCSALPPPSWPSRPGRCG